MSKFKVIIIDDERLAREEIKRNLCDYPEFEIIGNAEHADEAEEMIKMLRPDMIFLDIQMPGRSGFELLGALNFLPEVIFITAFDAYAVKAFEVSAIDYLVKPFREERFAKAISRVKERLDEKNRHGQTIFVKEGDRVHWILVTQIRLITSFGNYVRLHFLNEKVYFKRSLNQMEELLDPVLFFRTSRTEIINTTCIKEARVSEKGRLVITLKTGEILAVSDRRSADFKKRIRT